MSERTSHTTRLLAAAGVMSAAALIAKFAADRLLTNVSDSTDVGLIRLQLAENHGVAFSVGHNLDTWLIAAPAAAVTTLLLAYICTSGWRQPRKTRWALAAIAGGAMANLIDRIPDGTVTDYFYTGWFPTFNLSDCYISGGALLLAIGVLHRGPDNGPTGPSTREEGQPSG